MNERKDHCHSILLLNRLSTSLWFRPHLEAFGGGTFLQLWVRRYLSRYSQIPLHIVCHSSREREELRGNLESLEVNIIQSDHGAVSAETAWLAQTFRPAHL